MRSNTTKTNSFDGKPNLKTEIRGQQTFENEKASRKNFPLKILFYSRQWKIADGTMNA